MISGFRWLLVLNSEILSLETPIIPSTLNPRARATKPKPEALSPKTLNPKPRALPKP